ncbi:MAG: hypothetical protein GX442_18790 [Candidatus Riflebacteria bacterium]|nr:hypothetical protein [Candidatus Riflebacteria bacterium]
MGKHLRILLQFWRASLIQAMEYRTSFFLSMLANTIDFTVGLAQYALFFTVAETVAGWEMPQLLAFYGVFMTVFSLHFIFLYPNLAAISRLVNTGTLDLVLVKPVSAQVLLSFRELSFEEVGSFLAAQALLAGLWATGRIAPGPAEFAGFLLALLISLTLIHALFLFLLGLAVWFEKLENTSDLLWTIFGLCRYPTDVFPRRWRWVFTAVVPIAFVATTPAAILCRGPSLDSLGLGLAMASLFGLMARAFWRWALRGYTSAGG